MAALLPETPLPAAGPTAQEISFADLWVDDLGKMTHAQVDWLWPGYVGRGVVSLLTSQWKAGKTTLVSLLLARLARGGELAGLQVQRSRAVVVSEESPNLWRQRHERLRFGRGVCFLCRPFAGKPSPQQWDALIDHVAELHQKRRMELLIVDPVSLLLPPFFESHAERMHAALLPLSRLTSLGMAVLLLHHPKKGDALSGQAARGPARCAALVDVMMELSCRRGASPEDRVRRLLAWSRYEETVRERVIELSANGLEYRVCESPKDEPFELGWSLIETVLRENTGRKLTRKQIHAEWLDRRKPDSGTLWRWLDRAVSLRRLCQEGEGHKGNPYRYWLPSDDTAVWRPDPLEILMYEQYLR